MAGFCHREVRKAARLIANEFYEIGARDNEFHNMHPNRAAFVDGFWGRFIPPARNALRSRLDDPETPISVKVQIAEVLALDDTAPKGGMGGALPVAFDDRDWSLTD